MRRFLGSILIFSALFLVETGCSGGSSEPANENSGTTPQAATEPQPITDAQSALNEGTRLLEAGETDQAIDVLLKAVDMDPNLADAYFQLGIAYALIEKRDAAKVEAEVTPTPDPKEKKPREYKTNSEKAFEKAVKAYKKLIDADEDNDAAYFNLGRAYNKLNEDEDAAKALKQAVKLKPEDTDYQTELGSILIKLAQYHEAIVPLKKALELDPGNIRAEELLDDAQAGRKRVDYAAEKAKEKQTDKADAPTATKPPAGESNSNTGPQTKKSPPPAFPKNTVN